MDQDVLIGNHLYIRMDRNQYDNLAGNRPNGSVRSAESGGSRKGLRPGFTAVETPATTTTTHSVTVPAFGSAYATNSSMEVDDNTTTTLVRANRDTERYNSVTINNLVDVPSDLSNFITVQNEGVKNYATQITIEIPADSECTPIDIPGIKYTGDQGTETIPFTGPSDDPLTGWAVGEIIPDPSASQQMRDGTTKTVDSGFRQIEIPVNHSAIILKASESNPNSVEMVVIGNYTDDINDASIARTARVIMKVPPIEEEATKGLFGWLKVAYKGFCYGTRIVRDASAWVNKVSSWLYNKTQEFDQLATPVVALHQVSTRRGDFNVLEGQLQLYKSQFEQLYGDDWIPVRQALEEKEHRDGDESNYFTVTLPSTYCCEIDTTNSFDFINSDAELSKRYIL